MDKKLVAKAINELKDVVCQDGAKALDTLAKGLGVELNEGITPKQGGVYQLQGYVDTYVYTSDKKFVSIDGGCVGYVNLNSVVKIQKHLADSVKLYFQGRE